eukprot:SAG11_NODE_2000_length_3942_cov_47.649753_2_plen_90_part_00
MYNHLKTYLTSLHRPNELDIFEWVSLAHRKLTTSIAPELRHDFLIDAFEPKEAAVLEGFEQQHMDATGNALTYEELAAHGVIFIFRICN